jgi:hypothetical protein
MEDQWSNFTAEVADWVVRHQLLVYIVLGIIAWIIVAMNYPLESLTPVYANY